MSPEIALLSETWELVKTHVNSKDRLHVAETMLRLFEENIDIQDIDIAFCQYFCDSEGKARLVCACDINDDYFFHWD